jgi:hypothetical protein
MEHNTAEGSSPIEIHKSLKRVYGEEATGVSAVTLWVHRFKSFEKAVGDRARSGRTATAATKKTKDKVDVLIWNDCRITISEQLTAKGNGKAAGMAIVRELG